MCLGVPLKVISMEGNEAIGEMNGIKKKIRIDLLQNLKLGDFVMVHAGFALEVIDETIANETLDAIEEVTEALKEKK